MIGASHFISLVLSFFSCAMGAIRATMLNEPLLFGKHVYFIHRAKNSALPVAGVAVNI